MASIVGRKCPSRNSEVLYNPVLLIKMKETAGRIASYLMTDDEAVRQDLAKSILITFILVDEKKVSSPFLIVKSTVCCLDTKDGFEDIVRQYAWFCGYTTAWNQKPVITFKSRF